ncbi:hypothetical protein cypCar_00009022, partial [Cyprinus carpio]
MTSLLSQTCAPVWICQRWRLSACSQKNCPNTLCGRTMCLGTSMTTGCTHLCCHQRPLLDLHRSRSTRHSSTSHG